MSSAPSAHEQWYNLLQQFWGTEIDFSQVGSYVESKLYAWSRLLAQAQGELEHAGNQANPNKAFEQIPLLELDYQIVPPAKAGVVDRQKALTTAYALPQGEIASNVVNRMRALLGAKMLAYVTNPGGNPVVVPSSPGSVSSGHWVDVRIPAKFLKLVDPVTAAGSAWVAYQDLDTSAVPTINWSPAAAFALTQTVLPTTLGAVGFYFTCTVAGTTGTTEPVWPQAVGSTVVDGTVTWTCTATIAPPLAKGDTVMVDAGNTMQGETVTVTAISNVASGAVNASQGNYLYFQASFTKTHDIGAVMTTGLYPYWWSTQRLAYIVLSGAAASDQPTRQSIEPVLSKLFRGVCQWGIVTPASTTSTGGIIGPITTTSPMGTTTIGPITYSNSV